MAITIRHSDTIAGLAFVALAAGIYVVSADFPTVPGMPEPGPAFFPRVIAGLIGALGLVLIAKSAHSDETRSHRIGRQGVVRIGVATLLLVGYVAAMPFLGFLVDTALFLVIFMWFSGVRSPVAALVIAVGVPLVLYYVFVSFLHVPLPEGSVVTVADYLPSLPLHQRFTPGGGP
jgi:hypothetical protein